MTRTFMLLSEESRNCKEKSFLPTLKPSRKNFLLPPRVNTIHALFVILLRAIQSTEYCLHLGKFNIRICCSAEERCPGGYLDLDIGYGLCFSSLLKCML